MSYSNSDVRKQLAVVENPHSVATSNPKIPDGAVTSSLGQRLHQYAKNVTLAATSHILLIPGLHTPLVYDLNGAGDTSLNNTVHAWSRVGTAAVTRTFTSSVRKWRMVSCGLKIASTSAQTANQGSWTARRFQLPANPTLYKVSEAGPTPFKMVACYPSPNANVSADDQTKFLTSNNNSQHPSFTSGKMEDLNGVYFQLQDISSGAHEFINVPDQVLVTGNGAWADGSTTTLNTAAENYRAVEQLFDTNFDCIEIAIASGSDVAIDVVANYELVLADTDASFPYMNETANGYSRYKSVVKKLRFKNKFAART